MSMGILLDPTAVRVSASSHAWHRALAALTLAGGMA
jgi:hypothetical protein